MWGSIILVVLGLILLSYPLEWLLTRGKRGHRKSSHDYVGRDVAPMIGFFAFLLLGLSFVDAMRHDVLYAWAWGAGFGLLVSLCIWIAYKQTFRASRATGQPRESTFRIAVRFFRTYGIFLVLIFFVINVVVRFLGPAAAVVEAFVAGALGTSVIGPALVLLSRSRQQASGNQE